MLDRLGRIPYRFDDTGDFRFITNIFTRITVNRGVQSERYRVVSDYVVKNGETPESIAEDKYGNVGYWWLTLVANPQILSMSDWPMSSHQLDEYLNTNYGSRKNDNHKENLTDLDLEFKDSSGNVIEHQSFVPDKIDTFETIEEYYTNRNDLRRRIKLVTPELYREFIAEFESALKSYNNEIQPSRRR